VESDAVGNIVFSEDQINQRVRELGEEITDDYLREHGQNASLMIVSILKGGFIFLADLIRHIHLDLSIDFMAISSYGESTRTSGAVKIVKDLSDSIYNKRVLVVEDIIDTGLTLSYILRNLTSRGPREIKVCTLLDRTARRIAPLKADYSGFQVGEEFLVGYGLDYLQKWRNLRYICALDTAEYEDESHG
jgi:hypoxanthine phosphoribosyltransferase